jgi:hypothetical protein
MHAIVLRSLAALGHSHGPLGISRSWRTATSALYSHIARRPGPTNMKCVHCGAAKGNVELFTGSGTITNVSARSCMQPPEHCLYVIQGLTSHHASGRKGELHVGPHSHPKLTSGSRETSLPAPRGSRASTSTLLSHGSSRHCTRGTHISVSNAWAL